LKCCSAAADGEHVRLTPDGVVQLLNVNNDDRGVYECTAKNKYTINGRTEVSEVILSRRLRVKSELAWLWPLIVIIAIVALLVLIIFVCECRKKRAEQKLRLKLMNSVDRSKRLQTHHYSMGELVRS
uniref:Immunoglobulin I-set domain-containing protein n=1 Tax=Parascaris equorum TaxID=6256 RepID=A0A914RUE0_PAREQ